MDQLCLCVQMSLWARLGGGKVLSRGARSVESLGGHCLWVSWAPGSTGCLSREVMYTHTWIMVLEKALESPLDSKEIEPVNPKGNQS